MPNPNDKIDFNDATENLVKIANWTMPFGKYKGRRLIDLPESYIMWFHQKGYPTGELGTLLALVYEIKLNSLEDLIQPLKI
jgi:uncharacterized protein